MKYSKKELLLNWVSCAGYLRKANDGVHISHKIDENNTLRFYVWEDHEPRLLNGVGDGGIKIYHEIVPKSFKGVVIGFKNKEIASRLYLAEDDDNDIPDDVPYDRRIKVKKEILEITPCAVVAYGNNRKRIVPIECIEHLLNVETVNGVSKDKKARAGGTQLAWTLPDDKDVPF